MTTRSILSLLAALAVFMVGTDAVAQDEAKPADKAPVADGPAEQGDDAANSAMPVGRYLELKSPIDARSVAWVKSTALELSASAQPNDRPVLIVRVPSGTSQYSAVYPLAKFLASSEAAKLRTVAWLPETVTGFNAIIPLACDEIVMHPDAELGDLGRGEALEDDQAAFVRSVIRKQNNTLVSQALVSGMSDPSVAVLRVVTKTADGRQSTQIVTREALRSLNDADLSVENVRTIKEGGVAGLFSAASARRDNYLVTRTAESKGEVIGAYGLPIDAATASFQGGGYKTARLIRIDSMIDPLLESFLERQIDRAVGEGADVIIFEITSPGGYLYVSEQLARKIADLDLREGDEAVRTVAYIPKQAYSGGTMVALGCDEIYLGPNANMGDAAPIQIQEGQQFEHAPEKVLSPTIATFTKLAKRKGRPPAIIRSMIDKDFVVYQVRSAETGQTWFLGEDEINAAGNRWIKEDLVPESKDLLTVDGERAHELKIAGPPMADFDALKAHLGIPPEQTVPSVEQTWVDSLVFFLNASPVTFALLMLGFFLIYLELHFMSGILAIGAAMCFGLFFWSKYLGGTAGSLELMLFVLGVVLIGLEIFVIPGFGVFGLTGVLLVGGAMVLASQTFQGMSVSESVTQTGKTVTQIGLAVLGVVLLGSVVGRYLPKMPLFRDLVLAAPGAEDYAVGGIRLNPELTSRAAAGGVEAGMAGKSITTLRPAGKARIGEELVDVVSEGPYVEPGVPIEVVEVHGNRVVVRQVDAV